MRTKHQIHVLGGHTDAVSSVITNGVDPQVITGSHDSTIKVIEFLPCYFCRNCTSSFIMLLLHSIVIKAVGLGCRKSDVNTDAS